MPKLEKLHQKRTGRKIMKKVWVPRLAVMAKYLSNAGVRIFSWSIARYGVSQRMRGSSRVRSLYRHPGSVLWSDYQVQLALSS